MRWLRAYFFVDLKLSQNPYMPTTPSDSHLLRIQCVKQLIVMQNASLRMRKLKTPALHAK